MTAYAKLLASAQDCCEKMSDTPECEVAFVNLLEYVIAHPQERPEVERSFVEGVEAKTLCGKLVAFCMHTLRYEAVRSAAARRIDPANPRGWGVWSDVVSSYEDDWENADLYAYYRNRVRVPAQQR